MTKRPFAARNNHLKARCLSLSVFVFALARTSRRVKLSRFSTADVTRARSRNGSRSATCGSRTDEASRLPLLLLSPLPTRRNRRPPSHYDAEIPAVKLECRLSTTDPDPLTDSSTPGLAFVMFDAPFSGGSPLSFVSPTREQASFDSSRLRTERPVSSLFAQPAFNMITLTSTAVTSPIPITISITIAPPSIAVAASVTTLASSSTSVSLPSTAPVAPSTTQSTVLIVTPVTADQNAQTSSTSVVTTASSSTRATSRRRKAERHSRRTQPKRSAREKPTAIAPIVLDSFCETHATVPTTENTAAATTTVSSIPNLLTAAENELMRVRAAPVAKFVYVHSCSPTPPFTPLRITDSPTADENPAASSPESVALLASRLPTCRRKLCRYRSQRVLRLHRPPRPARDLGFQTPRDPDSSSFATTGNALIQHGTEAGVPLESPASPISFSSWNTSRSQWPTSQTRVVSPELPSIETSPRNVTIDPREEPRRPPESASSHWSSQPPPVRTQQTALEQTHISLMNDAVAIVLETNPYTFRDNGFFIDLARRIVVVEKRRILLNVQVHMSAPSVLLPPVSDRSTRADLERPLQTYANLVAILSERLKTRLCVFYHREYMLDAIRFALPRERTVDLGQYMLLWKDAHRKGGAVWSRSRASTASERTSGGF